MLVGRLGHWGPAGGTKGTTVLLVDYKREGWDDLRHVPTLDTFWAGCDASCSSSGNKEQRAHDRKYSDFPGLPMSASEWKDLSLPSMIYSYCLVWGLSPVIHLS